MKTMHLLFCIALWFFSTLSANSDLAQKLQQVQTIQEQVAKCSSCQQKLDCLNRVAQVKDFLNQNPQIRNAIEQLPLAKQYAVTSLIAIGQGPNVFYSWNEASFANLAEVLETTERFYEYIGGVIGYHQNTLQLIYEQITKSTEPPECELLPPPSIDIRHSQYIKDGLEALAAMGEIYVVGGAGDRLKLVDDKTKQPLPVARLSFCGKTLLEGLVRDLEAREYLYYKLTGKQLVTPIILMTSKEKNNDKEIAAICEECHWFGRPKESFFFLLQPMIPVLTANGNWAVSGPCDLILKPGGHGVIWKLANDAGAFTWLENQGKSFCIVRQINNPLSGLDHGLLSLAGYGYKNHKAFGFESCPRQKGLSEGMNVLCKTKGADGRALCTISNIEYPDFAKRKESDANFAKIADSPDFPANTNILYANIEAVKSAQNVLPIPGFLVNMKHPVDTLEEGKKVTLLGARLESTMQNIADAMGESDEKLAKLKTFVLVNDRSKIMSVTKKAYDSGASIAETPEGCFYDLMKENSRLLREECHMDVAEMNDPQDYLKNGPTTLFLYHPTLGPLYSIIAQKVSQGHIAPGSELQINAAEVYVQNLNLNGSLLIDATRPVGLHPGRIALENVSVKNDGIDRQELQCYWKNCIKRKGALSIHLEDDAEFSAKDVAFVGSWDIQVPKGCRAEAVQEKGTVQIHVTPVGNSPSWQWSYTLDPEKNAVLLHR